MPFPLEAAAGIGSSIVSGIGGALSGLGPETPKGELAPSWTALRGSLPAHLRTPRSPQAIAMQQYLMNKYAGPTPLDLLIQTQIGKSAPSQEMVQALSILKQQMQRKNEFLKQQLQPGNAGQLAKLYGTGNFANEFATPVKRNPVVAQAPVAPRTPPVYNDYVRDFAPHYG